MSESWGYSFSTTRLTTVDLNPQAENGGGQGQMTEEGMHDSLGQSQSRIFGRLREEKARLQQAIDDAKKSQDVVSLDLVEQMMSENNRLRADVAGRSSDLQLSLARAKEHIARVETERDRLRAHIDDLERAQTDTESLTADFRKREEHQNLAMEKLVEENARLKRQIAEDQEANVRNMNRLTEKHFAEIGNLNKQMDDLKGFVEQAQSQAGSVKAQGHATVSTLKGHIVSLQEEATRLTADLAAMAGKLAEKEAQLEALQGHLADAEREHGVSKAKLAAKERETEFAKERITELDSIIAQLRTATSQSKSNIKDLNSKLSDTESKMAEVIAELQGEIVIKDQQLGVLKGQISTLTGVNQDVLGQVAQRETEIATFKKKVSDRDEEIRDWNRHLAAVIESNKSELNVVMSDLNNQLAAKVEELQSAKDQAKALKERLASQTADIEELNVRLAEKEADFDGLTVRFAALHESNATALKAASEDANKRVAVKDAEIRELKKRVASLQEEMAASMQALTDDSAQKLFRQQEEMERLVANVASLQHEIEEQSRAAAEERKAIQEAHQATLVRLQSKFQARAEANVEEILVAKESRVSELEAKLSAKDKEVDHVQGRIQVLQQEVIASSRLLADKEAKIAELLASVEGRDADIRDLKVSVAALNRLNEASKSALHDAKEESKRLLAAEVEGRDQRIKTLQARVDGLLEGWDKAAADLAAQAAEIEALSKRSAQAEARAAEMSTDSSSRLVESESKVLALTEKLATIQDATALEVREVERQMNIRLAEKDAEIERLAKKIIVLTESASQATEEANQRLTEKVTAMHEARRTAEEKQIELSELKRLLEAKEGEVKVLQARTAADASELEQRVQVLMRHKETSAEALRAATEELTKLNACTAERESEIWQLKASLRAKQEEAEEMGKRVAKVEEAKEKQMAEIEQQKTALSEELRLAKLSMAEMENEKKALSEQLSASKVLMAEIEKEKRALSEELSGGKAVAGEVEAERKALLEELSVAKGIIAGLRQELEALDSWSSNARAEIGDLHKALVDRDAEIEVLSWRMKEAVAQHEHHGSISAALVDEARIQAEQSQLLAAQREAELVQVKAVLAEKEAEVAGNSAMFASFQKSCEEKLRAALLEHESMLQAKDTELAQAMSRLTALAEEDASRVAFFHGKIEELEHEVERKDAEARAMIKAVSDAGDAQTASMMRCDEAQKRIADKDVEMKELQARMAEAAKQRAAEVQDLTGRLAERDAKIADMEAKAAAAEASREKLDITAQDISKRAASKEATLQAELESVMRQLVTKESKIEELDERVAQLHVSHAAAAKAASEDMDRRLMEKNARIDELMKRIKHVQEEGAQEVRTAAHEWQAKLDQAAVVLQEARDDATRRVAGKQEEIDALMKKIAQGIAEVEGLKSALVERDVSMALLDKRLSDAKVEIQSLNSEIQLVKDKAASAGAAMEANAAALKAALEELEARSEEREDLRRSLSQRQSDLAECEATIRDLSRRAENPSPAITPREWKPNGSPRSVSERSAAYPADIKAYLARVCRMLASCLAHIGTLCSKEAHLRVEMARAEAGSLETDMEEGEADIDSLVGLSGRLHGVVSNLEAAIGRLRTEVEASRTVAAALAQSLWQEIDDSIALIEQSDIEQGKDGKDSAVAGGASYQGRMAQLQQHVMRMLNAVESLHGGDTATLERMQVKWIARARQLQAHVEDRGNRLNAEILSRDYDLLRVQRELALTQAKLEAAQSELVKVRQENIMATPAQGQQRDAFISGNGKAGLHGGKVDNQAARNPYQNTMQQNTMQQNTMQQSSMQQNTMQQQQSYTPGSLASMPRASSAGAQQQQQQQQQKQQQQQLQQQLQQSAMASARGWQQQAHYQQQVARQQLRASWSGQLE